MRRLLRKGQVSTSDTAPTAHGTTTDPTAPGLTHGADVVPVPQAATYLVLSEAERDKGYVRPYRDSYLHDTCGSLTRMSASIAGTYARNPGFYGATFCVACSMHRPLSEFVWEDGSRLGS